MPGDVTVTLSGFVATTPTLFRSQSGNDFTSFRIAQTRRYLDRERGEWVDGDALFLRCTVWRDAAENVAESLTRGMRVMVSGRLRQRSFETREGEQRTVIECEVDEVGPSLRYATAKVDKVARGGGGLAPRGRDDRRGDEVSARRERRRPAPAQPTEDPYWGGGSDTDDEPPF